MGDGFTLGLAVPEEGIDVEFDRVPITDQSFESALHRARDGDRLTIADAVELVTTGTEEPGIDHERKEAVVEIADRRRAERFGDTVTFAATLHNDVTDVCTPSCLLCSPPSWDARFSDGVRSSPATSGDVVTEAVDCGINGVTATLGVHPALALDDDHRAVLEAADDPTAVDYDTPDSPETSPGTYVEQVRAMDVDGVGLHAMSPVEAHHAQRGAPWGYEEVYRRLAEAGLDSVPGGTGVLLADEVRRLVRPDGLAVDEWLEAMEAAAAAGLDTTATITYGHVENAAHRVLHLRRIRDLQERTGAITAFVPLPLPHEGTPLHERGYVDEGATTAEDELLVAVSRLFLDNVEHVRSSWRNFGDARALKLLTCGADDLAGTRLRGRTLQGSLDDDRAFRSFREYVDMIVAVGRTPVERSLDHRRRRVVDPSDPPFGPQLGPRADGTPLIG